MTLPIDAAVNRTALVAQLYDAWRGYYVLRKLVDGAWCDVRALSRDEAETWRCGADESLGIAWTEKGKDQNV